MTIHRVTGPVKITIDGEELPPIERRQSELIDHTAHAKHFHHCPECYEKKPCYGDCTIEYDEEDERGDGERLGACCFCDDCSFQIICPQHGTVRLSPESYRRQMENANARWRCWCGEAAAWDDDFEERKQERAMHMHLKRFGLPTRPSGLPRMILAPLFTDEMVAGMKGDRFGACTRCGVCLRSDIRGGKCTVCARPLVPL